MKAILMALCIGLFGVCPSLAKMDMGMNLNTNNYYSLPPAFTDIMKSADDMRPYKLIGGTVDMSVMASINRDSNGWPTELPYNDGVDDWGIQIYLNNYYSGVYVLEYDGAGTIAEVGGVSSVIQDGKYHLTMEGDGSNCWIKISASTNGNHINNMRLIPHAYEGDEGNMPIFTPLFLQGLAPFKAIRLMDWPRINNSPGSLWADRITTTYYTQGQDHSTSTTHGVAWEYAYELANELNADLWICIPHQASDNYIQQLANLLKDNLETNLKVYVEFSNEMWNSIFDQYTYVINNAPGHPNGYVSTALAAIGAAGTNHPKKDAYMMARAFNLFWDEWTGSTGRLVRVAAVQTAWAGNTNVILNYIFNTLNATWGSDCFPDVVAVTGYTRGITADQHAIWNADPGSVTAAAVVAFIEGRQSERDDWLTDTKGHADNYGGGLPVVAYEAGQHLTKPGIITKQSMMPKFIQICMIFILLYLTN
jgi:hypothetical protein